MMSDMELIATEFQSKILSEARASLQLVVPLVISQPALFWH